MFADFSVYQWTVAITAYFIAVLPILLFIPTVQKAGFSAWWVVLALIPPLPPIMLWVFAFVKWPNYPHR